MIGSATALGMVIRAIREGQDNKIYLKRTNCFENCRIYVPEYFEYFASTFVPYWIFYVTL